MGSEKLIPTTRILGVPVHALTPALALSVIDEWVQSGERHYVCVREVNGVIEAQKDPEFLKFHEQAGLVTPDGMPLVWLSRWRGQRQVERVYGPDLMLWTCAQGVEKNYRHFLYGGAPGVADELKNQLEKRFPGIQIVGTDSPPFRKLTGQESLEAVEKINRSGADIVWVGIGSPKQEYWMNHHRSFLKAPVLLGVGAAFDFHSGTKKTAPSWMKRHGLEWLFRLMTEPRRLWRRYLIRNPLFVMLVLFESLGLRKHSSR